MNLGSGKGWREDCLNLDLNADWLPDIVADLNLPLPGDRVFHTARFGEVRLAPESLEVIFAHDVLEHVRELTTCMTSCLTLLREGGVLDVRVPYDLSLGAWQDPSHVRAFNENSFLYYTDWHWYLGWREARFELTSLEFVLGETGRALAAAGMDAAQLRRAPRAVEHLAVTLTKTRCSPRSQARTGDKLARYLRRPEGFFPAA